MREVIVVDDGSTDGTADVAREAGAEGHRAARSRRARRRTPWTRALPRPMRKPCSSSMPTAPASPPRTSTRSASRSSRAARRCRWAPSTTELFWNPLVLRWPPLTGERILPRWVLEAIPPQKLDGYTIEMRINEVVAERRLPTVARTMRGVHHRTKRDKHGRTGGRAADLRHVPRPDRNGVAVR